jgi:hypothetical protein
MAFFDYQKKNTGNDTESKKNLKILMQLSSAFEFKQKKDGDRLKISGELRDIIAVCV